ncbi:MAG: DUF126 domain-containing protein [Vicinamibacterales bacterium]
MAVTPPIVIDLEPIVAGAAEGPLLVSSEPLSFWGGYDSRTGEIIDRRHSLAGRCGRRTILVLPATRGSSTTTAVLLESVRAGTAPAAIIVGDDRDTRAPSNAGDESDERSEPDRFLALASIVAAEMYGAPIPLFTIARTELWRLRSDARATITPQGRLTVEAESRPDVDD